MKQLLIIASIALIGCNLTHTTETNAIDVGCNCKVTKLMDAGADMDRVVAHDDIFGDDITFLADKGEFKTGDIVDFKPCKSCKP